MRLIDFLLERRDQTVPVDVEYEYEYETSKGDVEYTMIIIECDVMITPDRYGTGDSPTGYGVTIHKAYFKDSKKPFNWKSLNKKEIDWIEDKAIELAFR